MANRRQVHAISVKPMSLGDRGLFRARLSAGMAQARAVRAIHAATHHGETTANHHAIAVAAVHAA